LKVYLKFAFKELKGLEITGIQKSATSLYIAHKEYLYILLSRLVSHCGSIYVHFHFFFLICVDFGEYYGLVIFQNHLFDFFLLFFFFGLFLLQVKKSIQAHKDKLAEDNNIQCLKIKANKIC